MILEDACGSPIFLASLNLYYFQSFQTTSCSYINSKCCWVKYLIEWTHQRSNTTYNRVLKLLRNDSTFSAFQCLFLSPLLWFLFVPGSLNPYCCYLKSKLPDGRGASGTVLRKKVRWQWMSLYITQVNMQFLELPSMLQCLQVSHVVWTKSWRHARDC